MKNEAKVKNAEARKAKFEEKIKRRKEKETLGEDSKQGKDIGRKGGE